MKEVTGDASIYGKYENGEQEQLIRPTILINYDFLVNEAANWDNAKTVEDFNMLFEDTVKKWERFLIFNKYLI